MEDISIVIKILVTVGIALFLCYWYVYANWDHKFNWYFDQKVLNLEYRTEKGMLFKTLLLFGYVSFWDLIIFNDIPLPLSIIALSTSILLQFTRLFKKNIIVNLETKTITLTYHRILFSSCEKFPLRCLSKVDFSREQRFSGSRQSRFTGLRWVLALILEDGPDRREVEILSIYGEQDVAKAMNMLFSLRNDPRIKKFPINYSRDDYIAYQPFGPVDEEYWKTKLAYNVVKNQSEQQDFNLNDQRPLAGEVRTYPLGEALFFSPKPLPSARVIPSALGESNQIVEINDTYMDIGQSNHGKAFQVQLVMSCIMLMMTVFLLIFFSVATLETTKYDGFFQALWIDLQEEGGIVFSPVLLLLLIGWYTIINTSLKKARQKPIRFNRQRREVCYFEEGSKTPTIVPWEETVSWVSMYKGFTGSAIVSSVTFGIALPDLEGKDYWIFKRPVRIMEEGQHSWEVIRCYMEEEPEFWAQKEEDENRQSFDENRRRIKQKFKDGPKPFFAMSMSDPTASYFNMLGYYVFNILCLWKLPYLVSEWDSKISMAKFPEDVDEWSKPLPKEEWAKPSAELSKQKAMAEAHYAAGGNLKTFRKLVA